MQSGEAKDVVKWEDIVEVDYDLYWHYGSKPTNRNVDDFKTLRSRVYFSISERRHENENNIHNAAYATEVDLSCNALHFA